MQSFKTKVKSLSCNPSFWICGAGMLILAVMVVDWWVSHPSTGIWGRMAALLSAGLFAAICLRFVPRWMNFWNWDCGKSIPAPQSGELSPAPAYVSLKIFFSLFLLNIAMIFIVYLLRAALGYGTDFVNYLEFWRCTDSHHYLDISRDWYLSEGDWDRIVQLVFLPGYPLVVRLVNYIVGYDLYSGLIVSNLCFAGAGCVFYRLMRLDLPHGDSIRTLKYLCIIPGLFFYTAPMSESLFLLLCVSCIYLARTGKWISACLLGGMAAFTRSTGLALLVPLFFELVHNIANGHRRALGQKGWLLRATSLLLIPLGFAMYLYINYTVSGNPLQFMEYQSNHWSQNFGLFFNTAAYQTENAIRYWVKSPNISLGLWIPNLIASFSALVIILLGSKKLRPSYTAWFLAYFFVAIGATWLLSAPRYLLVMLPLPMTLTMLTKKRRTDWIVSGCCLVLGAAYLFAFTMRWQVW